MKASKVNLNLLILTSAFMFQMWLTSADWIELPKIIPPNKNLNQGQLTTKVPHVLSTISKVINKKLALPSAIESIQDEDTSSVSFVRSYEDNGDSIEISKRYQPRPWKTKPLTHRKPFNNWSESEGSSDVPHFSGGLSQFSGNSSNSSKRPSVDTKKYYRWRNATFSKVQAHPSIGDNVDYTILSPDVISTESSDENTPLRYSYPKTVIISSRTPLVSHFADPTTKRPFPYLSVTQPVAAIDTKIDKDILVATTEGYSNDRYDSDEVTVSNEETDEEEYQHDDDDEQWEEYEGEEDELEDDETPYHPGSEEKKFQASPLPPPPSPPPLGGFMGFLQFLKNIQQKLSFAPSTPIDKKVNYLQELSEKATADISKY